MYPYDLLYDIPQLVYKVRNGQRVEDAVEDLINREVGELRKNAFGDDINDARGLPWSREQAWAVFRLLSKADEVSKVTKLSLTPKQPYEDDRFHTTMLFWVSLLKVTRYHFGVWSMQNLLRSQLGMVKAMS